MVTFDKKSCLHIKKNTMSEWVSQNSALILSVFGMLFGSFGLLLRYMRVSRCQRVDCCGCHFERDVIPADQAMGDNLEAAAT